MNNPEQKSGKWIDADKLFRELSEQDDRLLGKLSQPSTYSNYRVDLPRTKRKPTSE